MTQSDSNHLLVPEDLLSNPTGVELARLWSADDHQFYVLNVEPYRDEPGV